MSGSEGPAEIILRSDEHITMRIVLVDGMMMQRWVGYVPSPVFRAIMDEALGHAADHGVRRWFNDLREMGAILQADEHWTMQDWFPRLARTQVSRMAFLMSKDYFNLTSVDRIMNVGTKVMPLAVGYFGDIEEARSWLMSTEMVLEPVEE